MSTPYYQSEDLPRLPEVGSSAPELWEQYASYYHAATATEGALSSREKALIALAIAHVLPCPYCIDSYTQACLERGASLEQMTEAIHVAAALRAGATLAHGIQMKTVADRLSL
jgi:alkylhydroperoxidase/carboxymuconolactone decarboxylase family protein